MSTNFRSEPQLQFSDVFGHLPEQFTVKEDPRGAWLRLKNAPSQLFMWKETSPGGFIFERFNTNRVVPILQVLSDHFNVTLTCELGLGRIVPGGNGMPPENYQDIDS